MARATCTQLHLHDCLAACSRGAPEISDTGQEQTQPASTEVNLYGWSEYVPQALLDGFTQETGISVKVQPTPVDDYETKFRTLLASGAPPDMMRINDNVVRDYAAAGQLLDLNQFIENSDSYIESRFTFPVTPWGTHPAWTGRTAAAAAALAAAAVVGPLVAARHLLGDDLETRADRLDAG